MRTLAELRNHMNKFKDAVVIVGPEIASMKLTREDFETFFNKKTLRRNPEKFFSEFKIKSQEIKSAKKTESQKMIMDLYNAKLISKIINLNNDDKLSTKNTINLHGDMTTFVCNKCDITYPQEGVTDNMTCEVCGRPLRPKMLLLNETYNDKDYRTTVDALNATHTLITVGLNYDEDAITDLISGYCNVKSTSEEEKILVAINTEDNKINDMDYNKEIGFHDFYVKDKECKEALKRLLKGLEVL